MLGAGTSTFQVSKFRRPGLPEYVVYYCIDTLKLMMLLEFTPTVGHTKYLLQTGPKHTTHSTSYDVAKRVPPKKTLYLYHVLCSSLSKRRSLRNKCIKISIKIQNQVTSFRQRNKNKRYIMR